MKKHEATLQEELNAQDDLISRLETKNQGQPTTQEVYHLYWNCSYSFTHSPHSSTHSPTHSLTDWKQEMFYSYEQFLTSSEFWDKEGKCATLLSWLYAFFSSPGNLLTLLLVLFLWLLLQVRRSEALDEGHGLPSTQEVLCSSGITTIASVTCTTVITVFYYFFADILFIAIATIGSLLSS